MSVGNLNLQQYNFKVAMDKSEYSYMIYEIKRILQHIIDGTEPPDAFNYNDLYASPEAMEDIRQWPTK